MVPVAALRFSRVRTIAVFAAAVVGCQDSFPSNVSRFEPPAQYPLWWREAELCSGTDGDLSRVRWYRSGPDELLQGFRDVAAFYDPIAHRIVLRWEASFDPRIVRHEMLHALHPRVSHPRDLFRQRCGDVVACTGDCEAEAGPAPTVPADVRRVAPTDLDVSIEATPAAPASALFDGHFALVVIARNPFAEPVMVNFPDSALGGGARVFGYELGADPSGARAILHGFGYDRGVGYFRANESKRAVFDWRVSDSFGSLRAPAGAYFAIGRFGNQQSDTVRFTIRPPE